MKFKENKKYKSLQRLDSTLIKGGVIETGTVYTGKEWMYLLKLTPFGFGNMMSKIFEKVKDEPIEESLHIILLPIDTPQYDIGVDIDKLIEQYQLKVGSILRAKMTSKGGDITSVYNAKMSYCQDFISQLNLLRHKLNTKHNEIQEK